MRKLLMILIALCFAIPAHADSMSGKEACWAIRYGADRLATVHQCVYTPLVEGGSNVYLIQATGRESSLSNNDLAVLLTGVVVIADYFVTTPSSGTIIVLGKYSYIADLRKLRANCPSPDESVKKYMSCAKRHVVIEDTRKLLGMIEELTGK